MQGCQPPHHPHRGFAGPVHSGGAVRLMKAILALVSHELTCPSCPLHLGSQDMSGLQTLGDTL